MSYKIIDNGDGIACIYYPPHSPDPGVPYMEVDSIPEGDGILKTDLKTLWYEPIPEPPIPEPEPDPEPPKPTQEERIQALETENAQLKKEVTELQTAFDTATAGLVPEQPKEPAPETPPTEEVKTDGQN